jgi:uncharacterized cupredoxin-like copper-binding protein
VTTFRGITAAAVGAAAILLSACGGSTTTNSEPASASDTRPQRIAATVGDYRIKIDRDTAPSGAVSFDIRNDGRVVHEFVILRSDHAADALPREADEVAEDAAGNVADEAEDIGPGKTVTLTTTLEPGRYVLICNLTGHYRRGMHAAFRVT